MLKWLFGRREDPPPRKLAEPERWGLPPRHEDPLPQEPAVTVTMTYTGRGPSGPSLSSAPKPHDSAIAVADSFFTKVVGVTFKNDDGSDRQKIIARCNIGDQVIFKNDPEDPKFPDAVDVHLAQSEMMLGHLSSALAKDFMRKVNKGSLFIGLISDLTGGTPDKPSRGVNLAIWRYERRA